MFIVAVALSACEPKTRENVFVPNVFGPDRADETMPPVAPYEPRADTAAESATAAGAIERARRGEVRQSPVIRQPGEATTTAGLRLRQPIRINGDGTVTMSFERIGVADFARAVFGEILGLDYTVNPATAGAISLQIGRPVPRDAVYPIAERALASIGVLVRRDGDLLVIEPDPRGPAPGGPVTALVVRRLEHVDRAQMEQALQPFLAPDARLSGGPLPDTLILSGSEDGVNALADLVDALDIDPLANRSFGLFPLSVASAAQVAEELRVILDTGQPPGPQVVEIERMNAVLVVTASRKAIEEAQFWVRKLDQSEAHGVEIQIYQVQNRRAADLAKLLQQALAVGEIGAIGGAVAPGLTELAVPAEGGAAGSPPPLLAPAPAAAQGGQFADVTVFADEGTNSVMTIAPPERYPVIQAALRRLDVQPVQVLIEATIVEVSLTDELQYGVRWFFESGNVSFGFSDLALGAIAPVFPGFNFVLDSKDVRAVVSALDAVSDVEVVSSPSLMVLNNETARLQIGDQVPIATAQSESVEDANAPIRNEIEYRDTGVILEITPRVNASGLVLLDIVQEVSDVARTTTSGIESPTISQRRFESSVLLNDRETLALGGLIRNSKTNTKNGIPILSDIPVIGAVFGSTELTADRTELLVVLRPIVVRNHNEAKAAYQELRAKLRGLDELGRYLPPN